MSMDLALEAWVSGMIELSKFKWVLGSGRRWQPGDKLKLFFAGYNGTRNTGADVRVEEMLRQIKHILGDDKCELSVLTQSFQLTEGYFKGVKQVYLPDLFPPMLWREVPQYDGVVAKGQALQEKQQNALALTDVEISDFEQHRDALLKNPVARSFIDAQQELRDVQESIQRHVKKTFELGRLPSAEDLAGGCCGDGHGCGCGH